MTRYIITKKTVIPTHRQLGQLSARYPTAYDFCVRRPGNPTQASWRWTFAGDMVQSIEERLLRRSGQILPSGYFMSTLIHFRLLMSLSPRTSGVRECRYNFLYLPSHDSEELLDLFDTTEFKDLPEDDSLILVPSGWARAVQDLQEHGIQIVHEGLEKDQARDGSCYYGSSRDDKNHVEIRFANGRWKFKPYTPQLTVA